MKKQLLKPRLALDDLLTGKEKRIEWREVVMPGAFDKYFAKCHTSPFSFHSAPMSQTVGVHVIQDNWRKENGEIIREIVEAEFIK